jgi:hypothetical protein
MRPDPIWYTVTRTQTTRPHTDISSVGCVLTQHVTGPYWSYYQRAIKLFVNSNIWATATLMTTHYHMKACGDELHICPLATVHKHLQSFTLRSPSIRARNLSERWNQYGSDGKENFSGNVYIQ